MSLGTSVVGSPGKRLKMVGGGARRGMQKRCVSLLSVGGQPDVYLCLGAWWNEIWKSQAEQNTEGSPNDISVDISPKEPRVSGWSGLVLVLGLGRG